jgi:receptor expression-enhancing protein 5/6
LAYE